MKETISLSADVREPEGKKVNVGRKEGLIPAVLYGHGVVAKSVWINALAFTRVFGDAGENTIIKLTLEKDVFPVLIHDVQVAPLSGSIVHIDFFAVRMDEKVETEIPLEFIGEAPAVKALGGTLVRSMDEVSVSCLPAHLPKQITVDLAQLVTFDDVISIGDLHVAQEVTIEADKEVVVALVAPPRKETEDTVESEAEVAEPELVNKKPSSEEDSNKDE